MEMKLRFILQQIGSNRIVLYDEERNAGIKRWENSLVGFVLGLKPPLIKVKCFAEAQWGSMGLKSVYKLKDGVFMFKFNSEDEMMEVIDKTWHYFEVHFILQIWSPKLDIDDTKIK